MNTNDMTAAEVIKFIAPFVPDAIEMECARRFVAAFGAPFSVESVIRGAIFYKIVDGTGRHSTHIQRTMGHPASYAR